MRAARRRPVEVASKALPQRSERPRRPVGLVIARERLLGRIFEMEDGGVALVRAPAGFGKTTLLLDWTARLEGEAERVVWLAGADLEGFEPSGAEPVWLVIDDAHQLERGAAERLRRLVERPPQGMRLIIAGRALPPLGLAKLRLNGGLLELGPSDLRFTGAEIGHLFAQGGAPLDPGLRAQIERLTDGWPAAARLAVPMMRQGMRTRGDVAHALTEPEGALGAYVREELLPASGEDREFLLETGALGRFSAELASEATGRGDAGERLRRLAETGALLSLDDQGEWRHHPLVAVILDALLGHEKPAAAKRLHLAACAWRRERGALSEAISHAFSAGAVDEAAALLAQSGETHERIGRWRLFAGWIARAPEPLLDRHPAIRVEAACAYGVLYEFELARRHADAAWNQVAQLTPRGRDELLLADAIIATFSDRPEAALAAGLRGIAEATQADAYVRGAFRLAAAVGWLHRRDVDRARKLLIEAQAVSAAGSSHFGVAMALALRGLTHAMEGELDSAAAMWREGEQAAERLENAAAVTPIAVGYLPLAHYERNELAAASRELERCFSGVGEIAFPDMASCMYMTAARLAFAEGRREAANAVLEEAEVTGLRRGWTRLVCSAQWERIRLALRRGDMAEARRLRLQQPPASAEPQCIDVEDESLGALEFRAWVEPDRPLIEHLRGAAGLAQRQKRNWLAVRLLIADARARDALGGRAAALRSMRRALEVAAPGRLVRSFLDAGTEILDLVAEVAAEEQRAPSNLQLPFLEEILIGGGSPCPETSLRRELEPLSPRELEVLKMVAAGLSNRELAARLFVSENTVKWHLQHVFAKLDVRNRTRALVVARQLGILT